VYYVYILKNPAGKFYIGISIDPKARLQQHNRGESKWTKGRGPWSLVWCSAPTTLSEARKLENLLKQQKGGDGFYRLTGLVRPKRS